MAEEIKEKEKEVVTVEKQLGDISKGVTAFQEKAAATEKALGDIKKSVETTAGDVKGLKDWQVKKDEADKKNQKALDDLLAKKGSKEDIRVKSFGEQLREGVEKSIDDIRGLQQGQRKQLEIDVMTGLKKNLSNGITTKAAADMTFANNFSTADNSITETRSGILTLPNRKVHMRQLLPLGTMSKSDYAYVKEVAGEGNLSTWKTGSAKPQFDLDLQEATAPAEYIAGFLVITKKMLDDVDGLISFLQMRLPEMYYKVEDAQILTGNGTAPNLSGLITNAQASDSTATKKYDQILDDLGQLEDTDYEATGILIRPSDYYKIVQSKASGSGEYDAPGVVQIVNGQLYFAGVPVYKSTAIASGTYLLGDFDKGAQLMIRENPVVEFFEQDKDNVRNNKITVRIEGRVSLPIYYDEAFITGTFAAY